MAILLALFPFATLFIAVLYLTNDDVRKWGVPISLFLLAVYSVLTGIMLARHNLRIETLEKRHGDSKVRE